MLDATPLPFPELPVDTALAAEPVAQPTADWAADLAVGDIVSFCCDPRCSSS
ncbi:hypothetical protein LAZ29_00735 [Cereibacter sphaeroides]|uniref:hypothetical protein n=1 Tax=Cereibacter sphaeroides TaxID=1063 RepID=UPI001F16CECF|nr:hypothetical protein [Cereibacter sphaeroides]MCE6949484.1 hypothetical protein [Cereibacter sphaeroides]